MAWRCLRDGSAGLFVVQDFFASICAKLSFRVLIPVCCDLHLSGSDVGGRKSFPRRLQHINSEVMFHDSLATCGVFQLKVVGEGVERACHLEHENSSFLK